MHPAEAHPDPLQSLCDAALAALRHAVGRLSALVDHDNPSIVLRAAHTLARIATLNRRPASPLRPDRPRPPNPDRSPLDPHASLLRALCDLGDRGALADLAAPAPPTANPSISDPPTPAPTSRHETPKPAAPTAAPAPPVSGRTTSAPSTPDRAPHPVASLASRASTDHPPWSPADHGPPPDPPASPLPLVPSQSSVPGRRSPLSLIASSGAPGAAQLQPSPIPIAPKARDRPGR